MILRLEEAKTEERLRRYVYRVVIFFFPLESMFDIFASSGRPLLGIYLPSFSSLLACD